MTGLTYWKTSEYLGQLNGCPAERHPVATQLFTGIQGGGSNLNSSLEDPFHFGKDPDTDPLSRLHK